jgi:hypothetical protein
MNEDALSQLYLKDTAFQDLMQKRIFNVLLVASPYDAFMMEEDGRIEEQLYFEYVALNLSSPPPRHTGFHSGGSHTENPGKTLWVGDNDAGNGH